MRKMGKTLLSLGLAVSMVFSGQCVSGIADDCNYVSAATKIKINKTKATIYVGKTVQLKMKGTKKKVTWKSSNKKVATVTSKGKVKGVKKGTATITAKVNKKKYTCKVTVKAKEVKVTSTPKPSVTTKPTSAPTPTVKPTTTPTEKPVVITSELPITSSPVTSTSPVTSSPVTPTQTPSVTSGVVVPTEDVVTTPIVEPTVTPETNKVADNINALKTYITKNGTTNSSGNKFIKWTDNDVLICQYAIIYEGDIDKLHFLAYVKGDDSDATISMYVDPVSTKDVSSELICIASNDFGYKAVATFDMETYTLDTDVTFKCTDGGISDENIQKLSNSYLRLAFTGWDILLDDKLSMEMGDLGFYEYNKTSTTTPTETPQVTATPTVTPEVQEGCRITMPDTPVSISRKYSSGKVESTVEVTDVNYSVEKSYDGKYKVTISVSGEKTYDIAGNNYNRKCMISWKLYKDNDVVADSGTIFTSSLAVGEKFENETGTIYSLETGNYRLELLDYN